MRHTLTLILLAACASAPPPAVVESRVPEPSPEVVVEVEATPLQLELPPLPGARLVLQTEHTDSIAAVRFTRNDSLVFTAGADGALKVRDLQGRLVWSQPVGGEIIAADVSEDGRTFGFVVRTGTAYALRLGGEPVYLAGPKPYVTRVALSANGEQIVTADTAGGVTVWSPTAERIEKFAASDSVWAVAISRDGRVVAAGDDGGRVWTRVEGQPPVSFPAHTSEVTAVALDPAGERLASAARGKKDSQSRGGTAGTNIKLWRAGELVTELPSSQTNRIRFSADGEAVVSAGLHDRTVRVWRDGVAREHQAGHDDRRRAARVDISADGELVVSASDDLRVVQLWSSGQLVRDLTLYEPPWTTSLVYAPDGRLIVGNWDRVARVWSPDGTLVATTGKHQGTVDAVAVSRDGRLFVTGSEYTRLWNRDAELVRVLHRNTNHANAVAFSGDGKRVWSGDGHGQVRVWDVARERELRTVRAHRDRVYVLSPSPDAKQVASGSPFGELKLWRSGLRKPRLIEGHGPYDYIYAVAWSPDGKTFASASVGGARIWNRQGAALSHIVTEHNNANVGGVAFSLDGRDLAISVNERIEIWRVGGERRAILRGHTNTVYAIAYSPTGLLASGGREQALRLWCVERSESVALTPHGTDWLALAGDYFAASPGGRELLLWVEGFTPGDGAALSARERPEAVRELLACDGQQ